MNQLYTTKCDSKGRMYRCSRYLMITVEEEGNMIFPPVRTVIEYEDIEETVQGLLVCVGAGRPPNVTCGLWTDWLRVSAGTNEPASAFACADCAWVHPPAPTSQSVS